jgi:DNA polymerase eta
MDKDYLFTHALSIWRAIEAEGRAFPAINISVGVSGFGGEVEEKGRGIEGFLVPGRQSVQGISSGNGGGGGGGGMNTVDVLGKRKRDDEGIAKFFGKKEDTQSPNHDNGGSGGGDNPKAESTDRPPDFTEQNIDLPDDVTDLEEHMMETYLCSKCQKQISIIEMEIHEDYHVALELSRGSPVRAAAATVAAAKGKSMSSTKKGRKEGKKEGAKGVEKGQMKLQFGV